jgi:uncharacterized protein with HEPN domain
MDREVIEQKLESLRRCLQRVVDKCPPEKAVGFRNIAVHNYGEIDWAIVHAIARHQLGDFTEFARVVGSRLAG